MFFFSFSLFSGFSIGVHHDSDIQVVKKLLINPQQDHDLLEARQRADEAVKSNENVLRKENHHLVVAPSVLLDEEDVDVTEVAEDSDGPVSDSDLSDEDIIITDDECNNSDNSALSDDFIPTKKHPKLKKKKRSSINNSAEFKDKAGHISEDKIKVMIV